MLGPIFVLVGGFTIIFFMIVSSPNFKDRNKK